MVAGDSEIWFDAVAAVIKTIDGVAAVFAGGRSGVDADVQPMIDESLMVTPAAVLHFDGGDILVGAWEHQDFSLGLDIWVEREPIGFAYATAVGFVGKVMAALPIRAKAGNVDSQLQYLIPMSVGAITPRAWPEASPHQYLVLPFTLQVRLARAAFYRPD